MGVIYKLKSSIIDFILEKKKENPLISCRQLVPLIQEKFQIAVSKSSINAVIKEAGLSMPVGRRRKKTSKQEIKPEQEIKLLKSPAFANPPLLLGVKENLASVPLVSVPPEPPAKEEPKPISSAFMAKPPTEKPPVEETPVKEPIATEAFLSQEKRVILPLEIEKSGIVFLKAADYLLGGTSCIKEILLNRFNNGKEKEITEMIEAILYQPFTDNLDISSYLEALKQVKGLLPFIKEKIAQASLQVRCIEVHLSDGISYYLDGQLHTVWSIPQIPYIFSLGLYHIKNYLKDIFNGNKPLVLCHSSGYNFPIPEFFNFMESFEAKEKTITHLTFYNNKLEKIGILPLERKEKRTFIFGLWPWQFGQFRKGKILTDFMSFCFTPLNKKLYLARVEIELAQPNVNKNVILQGCALKEELEGKIKLIILTNSPLEMSNEELVNLYLESWPNLEETFMDFSKKVEFFTYTSEQQKFFFLEKELKKEEAEIEGFFRNYLDNLDNYVRWQFFPAGYEEKDFSLAQERFYSLKADFNLQAHNFLVAFKVSDQYPFLRDLEYACRRINEKKVVFMDGKRCWLSAEKF